MIAKQRPCAWKLCAVSFTPTSHGQRYHAPECKVAANLQRDADATLDAQAVRNVPRFCENDECTAALPPPKREGRPRSFCNVRCRRNQNDRDRRRATAAARERRERRERIAGVAVCGATKATSSRITLSLHGEAKPFPARFFVRLGELEVHCRTFEDVDALVRRYAPSAPPVIELAIDAPDAQEAVCHSVG